MRSMHAVIFSRLRGPRSFLLVAIVTACGGSSDRSNLFSGSPPGADGSGAGTGNGGTSAMSQGGTAGTPPPAGTGGLTQPPGTGGEVGAGGGVFVDAGGGGVTSVDAGIAAGGNGTGGATVLPLPTGTQGFPTNVADCPATLPGSNESCNFPLTCQYPGMLCTCGFNGTFACTAQANQCLVQEHCTTGYCHPNLHVCTECVDATPCGAPTPECRWDGVCVQCVGDSDCAWPTPVCNVIPLSPALSTCVQCGQDSDCAKSQTCQTFLGTCQ